MLDQLRHRPMLVASCMVILLGLSVIIILNYTLFASPTPRGVNCGTIYVYAGNEPVYDANVKRDTVRASADCFWNAYQHCQTATLIVHQEGIDTSITSMFIVDRQQESCILTDTMQETSANFGGSQSPYKIYTCSALLRNGYDFDFNNCGKLSNLSISL